MCIRDSFSVSVGGDYHVTDSLRVGGTVFRTERAPTTEELFSNGPHLATNQFEIGDITLNEETALGVEGAIRFRGENNFFTVNGFYTDYDDYIFQQELGTIEDGLPVFLFTGEDAEFRGFEIQGGTHLASFSGFDIGVDALAEFVRADSGSGDLPRIPPFSVLAGIEAKSDYLTLRAEIEHASEQNRIETFELPTEDYQLVNLYLPIGPFQSANKT